MSTIRGKNNEASRVEQLITGTNKHFPNGSEQLAFGGATRTVSALTALLQSFVDLRAAVIASQAASKAKVSAEAAQAPSLLVVVDQYVAFVKATFGDSPDTLTDFGLSPAKAKAPQSAVQKAIAAAKRKATREARGTMGKNQKKAIKGAITVTVTTTPIPASPPAVVPPATSGNAPNGGSTPHA